MKKTIHKADFCVIGGGLAGMCAAIAAARQGLQVVLMQDRPILGGNASSEIRMWVCGAHGDNMREAGILEELQLENLYRNTYPNYSVWDSVLYGKARYQDNLTLLLNCSCTTAVMDGAKIKSVTGWQLTTETGHTVEAAYFSDCSGDSILAPLTGADFRVGHEAADEFSESIAPDKSNRKTMGMSCLLQARETDSPKEFIPPAWAHTYTDDSTFPHRGHNLKGSQNFWWLELGGEDDSIHDTETLRDELLKVAFGVWDHIKNRGDHEADNWQLEWVGFLPGKRESRRYMGDHILTQNDVRAEGKFDDIVAYGGWSMDDHHPAGLRYEGKPTIFHSAPSPYGIPYRSLYSRNIENLFFAGRNISTTHAALSSTRVMATCAVLGQAVGTAAAIASKGQVTPRGVYESYITELQQQLMQDDCYIPWHTRKVSVLTAQAEVTPEAEALRNGIDRAQGENFNSVSLKKGASIEYRFKAPVKAAIARLVFDSNLNRPQKNMPALYRMDQEPYRPPMTLVKDFRIEAESADGVWTSAAQVTGNYQRLVNVPLKADTPAQAFRLAVDATWGADQAVCFAWDLV